MSDAIVAEALTCVYGTHIVVDKLNLQIPEHTVFGFLGPNGAGKSTTIRLLTSQTRPSSGKAWVAGIDVVAHPQESHRHIGYLSELPNFYPWMRGYELLEFVGELFGLKKADRYARSKELLKLVGLEEAARRKIGTYSGGMRQRLGIAQALVNRPEVIFLDEPVSALDPLGRRDVLQLLDNLRQEATVFMSSHVLADVDRVCEQIAIIDRGRLLIAGQTNEIKEKYTAPLIEVEVTGEPATLQELKQTLQTQVWLKTLTTTGDRLHLELTEEEAVPKAGQFIPAEISRLGLTLLNFQTALPTLEDIFVKLIGESEAGKA